MSADRRLSPAPQTRETGRARPSGAALDPSRVRRAGQRRADPFAVFSKTRFRVHCEPGRLRARYVCTGVLCRDTRTQGARCVARVRDFSPVFYASCLPITVSLASPIVSPPPPGDLFPPKYLNCCKHVSLSVHCQPPRSAVGSSPFIA